MSRSMDATTTCHAAHGLALRERLPRSRRVFALVTLWFVLGLSVVGLLAGCAQPAPLAQTLDAALEESVVRVPKKVGPLTVELETTLFKPRGDGPFPIVLMNHGKAAGDPRFQPRFRPRQAVPFFLERGYAVVAPMRQGFSSSGGAYVGGGCNVESNGRAQADDLAAVLDYVRAQPWADKERIVVLGQSHGGWATLALGARGYPGVKGLINFAGGLRQEGNCTGWQGNLARAAGAYGRQTSLSSLWLYGDNDSYFPVDVWRPMHERYVAAGGKAELIAFGKFGNDSHTLFASRDGARVWHEPVSRFLQSIGMPAQPNKNAPID